MNEIARRDTFFDTFDSLFDPFMMSPTRTKVAATTRSRNYVMRDEEDGLHIDIALPGIKRENITVKFEDGILKVDCSETNTHFGYYAKNYSWRLSDGYDVSGVSAKLEDGVLELHIPKKEKEVNVIEVK